MPDAWVSVERNQTQRLGPGTYGNYSVKEGGTLELTPGRYYFRSLGAEPNATLRVTGSAGGVFIYVKGDFTFRGVQAFQDAGQEMMVVSFAQQVTLERPFEGVVMAPEGTLALGGTTGQTFTGQFFGAYVEIRNAATIGLRPFSYGLWNDADECGWGADEGAECEYDVACPGASERRCVSRNEWDMVFNHVRASGEPGSLLEGWPLRDSWAWWMTRQCLPEAGSDRPNLGCRVLGSDPDDTSLRQFQAGAVAFDRGANAVGVYPDSEERLDYILLGPGRSGDFVQMPLHVSIAHNLKDGHEGTSSFLRQHENNLDGGEPLSDHLGYNAEIDDYPAGAQYLSPAEALDLGVELSDGTASASLHFEYEDGYAGAGPSRLADDSDLGHWSRPGRKGLRRGVQGDAGRRERRALHGAPDPHLWPRYAICRIPATGQLRGDGRGSAE